MNYKFLLIIASSLALLSSCKSHREAKEDLVTDTIVTPDLNATASDFEETSESYQIYDSPSNASSSSSTGKYYDDDVDEMFEGVAEDTKAELRKACREVGVDYYDLYDDADIDREVEELKAETRKQLRELGY